MSATWRDYVPFGLASPQDSPELPNRQSPQSRDPETPLSPTSEVISQMSKLRLDSSTLAEDRLDETAMPGSFLFEQAAAPQNERSSAMESLEMLLTAAMLTDSPTADMNPSHSKLFSPASECYEHAEVKLPPIRPLDLHSAVVAIAAVAKSKLPSILPAARVGGRRFTSKSVPLTAQLPCPLSSASPPLRKTEKEEVITLDRLSVEFDKYHSELFDGDIASLSTDAQLRRLDKVSNWLSQGLVTIETYEDRMRYRNYKASQASRSTSNQSGAQARDRLRERMRCFHAKVCALYAPLIPESPIRVDSDHLFNPTFANLDQLNQVLILFAVICHLVIGLSVDQSNFLVHASILCVYLAMSTGDSRPSSLHYNFSPLQSKIIADMPKNLADAMKKFDVDGHFDFYATCPSCSYTNKAHPLQGKRTFYNYPKACSNDVVGPDGITTCGTNLLRTRHDGTSQPIKPYLVPTLSDYLARCLSDATFVEQSKEATDLALHTISSKESPLGTQSVFDGEFIKDFKGPDGKLFVDRGDKLRLAFSMHVDFFNPNRITHRGAHDSIGVISCANLALDPSIRYQPEYIYATIIPGPNEPTYDELDHYVRRIIEQFVQTWRPGLHISHTADSANGAIVEAAILISVNDLPAARKVAGLQGHMSSRICSVCDLEGKDCVFDTDCEHWTRRDVDELRKWAWAYRNAKTLAERQTIFNTYGVRWSSFWLLEYWDPTRMLVIDAMHCILEGLVHYHCRHVLRLDASAAKLSSDGLKVAFDWPWVPYSPEFGSGYSLDEKHISGVVKTQETLTLSLLGKKSLTLNGMWTRLDNQSVKDAVEFVVDSLDLPKELVGIHPELHSLYVARAKNKSKRKGKNDITFTFPHGQQAKTKHQFIVLLLNWRLQQPHASEAYIIPTGTAETLADIQKVIAEMKRPAHIPSVPKNFGEAKAGSIKANEWKWLSILHIPVALVIRWGDNDGLPPPVDDSEAGYLLKALDHTMAIFQATMIACRQVMTRDRAEAYRRQMAYWTENLRLLFPHVRGGNSRPNIHAGFHIYDFLLLFGPVMSWWCFPFERLIGVIQKINTNDHKGGEMEATMVKTMARTANIRRWLHRSDCPDAVRFLKDLFDRCFVPVNGSDNSDEFVQRKGKGRAYVAYDGGKLSPAGTHEGNSTIIYRASPCSPAVAGQIQFIENVHRPNGHNTGVRLHVRPHEPLSKALYDPFSRYPHFNARTYSSTLREAEDIIDLDGVVSAAARYDYSYGRSVVVNLSRE